LFESLVVYTNLNFTL